jgi:hypothetical protein
VLVDSHRSGRAHHDPPEDTWAEPDEDETPDEEACRVVDVVDDEPDDDEPDDDVPDDDVPDDDEPDDDEPDDDEPDDDVEAVSPPELAEVDAEDRPE